MPDFRVIALVVILLFTGIAVASASYSEHAYERDDVSADITVSHDEWIDLPGSDVENATVTDENGTALTAGDDYILDRDGGRIQFPSDGTTAEGETASAAYSASVPNDLAESFAGDQSSIFGAAAIVSIILAIGAALVALSRLHSSVPGRGWP